MSARNDSQLLVIGGEPRIDFLPHEIKRRKTDRRFRRSLIALVIVVAVVCAGGYGVAAATAVASQGVLDSERAKTTALLQEQGKYAEARSAAVDIDTAKAAAIVGSGYEILWQKYLAELYGRLPAGVTMINFSVSSQETLVPLVPSTVLLEKERVATITFTVNVPSYAEADQLIVNLEDMTGFADATMTGVAVDEGINKASYVLHVTSAAFERRLFETPAPDAATADSTDGDN